MRFIVRIAHGFACEILTPLQHNRKYSPRKRLTFFRRIRCNGLPPRQAVFFGGGTAKEQVTAATHRLSFGRVDQRCEKISCHPGRTVLMS
jgi:hypothetical protein